MSARRPVSTRDDASAMDAVRTRFFAAAALGEKQAVTPDGFLICYEVPLARTGTMWYAESELRNEDGSPLITGAVDGKIEIERDESEVFRPDFVASFAGKPVVNDHPPVQVTPENWKQYAVGTVFNPRRGASLLGDYLIGDLLICDPAAISDVRSGKREVSCGYDAEYEQTAPGKGRQYNMVGNHVALVESGRCGPRCSIGDRRTKTGDADMRTIDHRTVDEGGAGGKRAAVRDWFKGFTDGLREAMKKGGNAFDEYLADASRSPEKLLTSDEGAEMPGSALHLHMGGDRRMTDEDIENRFKEHGENLKQITDMLSGIAAHVGYKAGGGGAGEQDAGEAEKKDIEGKLKEEAPTGTNDAAIKAGTKDSALLEDAYREALSLGEILVPGIRPTMAFDKAAPAKKTLDALCGFRRTALDLAYHQAEGRAMIDQVTGGKFDPKALSCSDVKTLFRSAAALRRTANDAMVRARHAQQETGEKKAPRTAEELNRRHEEFYHGKKS